LYKNICLSRRQEAKITPQALRKSAAGTLRSAAGEIFEKCDENNDFLVKKQHVFRGKIAIFSYIVKKIVGAFGAEEIFFLEVPVFRGG